MIIVDTALAKRQQDNNPVRVAIVGAGYMGRGVALQILQGVPGMKLVAVANRTLEEAERAYQQAGVDDVNQAHSLAQLDTLLAAGKYAVTSDPALLCQSRHVDAVVEATGDVEFSAHVAMSAIENRKHIILMNAELDATVGPILKVYADRAGVVMTNVDGDQPGVVMNLLRYVKSIGCRPVLAGNIKGLQDPYRTPETQRAYAEQFKQKPRMVTSFADGTKISMEMAVVANATGFKVGQRGMYGPACADVNDSAGLFPLDEMLETGLVDYVLGAQRTPGVFVLGYNDNPIQQQYLKYYKMGDGPLYVFYTPYHLCHLEVPLTVARAVLFGDAAVAPIGGPVVDVITLAKRDLKAGEVLDGIGGFTCYGAAENSSVCHTENLLPMGLSEGCRMKRDVPRDYPITYDDVELPADRLCDRLRAEQNTYFHQ
ncbi:MAG TPA: Gfo/Idh/MocA family oxidoreductase [Candidatus Thiothrix moscowensis]|uniref:NAD(P)H-dependent oxidoreductase n=1 Tax=unclassified Thiothrix TaxID=2636184 RepID=UPI0025DE614E|nr:MULTISPECIES: Gfo/Idh/MocA family oxidoreductase [unclassified Thiothrix]HRJ52317.1 Gfo/Idh/MocA family oxidoreductase [Candidatus Thiothrix moscowensis]HRJ92632.1 Gfo/Idh/MocA family oxidoreductase [Candidatus Thiothrix moscowensis]